MYIPTRAERFESARTEFNVHGSQSIAEVSKATGVVASMISDLENNDKIRGVNYEAVAALAKHYGVFADYLVGLSAVPNRSADVQLIEKYTGLSVTSVERLSGSNQELQHTREIFDRLLSADSFPKLLRTLNKIEHSIQTADRAIEYREQTGNDMALTLLEERLSLSVFRVVKAMTDICYEIFPIAETEAQLNSLDGVK